MNLESQTKPRKKERKRSEVRGTKATACQECEGQEKKDVRKRERKRKTWKCVNSEKTGDPDSVRPIKGRREHASA